VRFRGLASISTTCATARPSRRELLPPDRIGGGKLVFSCRRWRNCYRHGLGSGACELYRLADAPRSRVRSAAAVHHGEWAAYRNLVIDGGVDEERRAYIESHIRAIADAIHQGVDVRGYFVWSLLDNFEWASGYTKRFGIYYVDFQTQARILKRSGFWYKDLAAAFNRTHGGMGAGET
jgi:hypothetical protein